MIHINLKHLAVIALVTQSVFSTAQTRQHANAGFTLAGTVKGIADGNVELSRYNPKNRTSTKLYTAKLTNGKFVVTGKLEGPEMLGLSIVPGNWGTQVFVENSKITLQIDTAGSMHYDYTKYGDKKGARLKDVKVSGSISHADYDQYENNAALKEWKDAAKAYNDQYYAEKDEAKKEQIRAKISIPSQQIKDWQLNHIRQFIAKNPSSAAGVYMLANYYRSNSNMDLQEIDGLLAYYTGAAKKSVYYADIAEEIAAKKAVLPGNFAEDFTLLQRDSTKFTLSSMKGKYVMIDFWASWCKPCRAAIPHWKEVYAKYKDKGFEIVSVTNDNRRNDWVKALDAEQMPWIQTIDEFPLKNMPARVISRYKHGTIPLYVLLDQQGKILVKSGNEEDVDHKLAEIFKP